MSNIKISAWICQPHRPSPVMGHRMCLKDDNKKRSTVKRIARTPKHYFIELKNREKL